MNKKGQVTLFIIIAIIIVAIILLFFLIIKPKMLEAQKTFEETKIAKIKHYASEKIREISEGNLALIYLQGGFIDPPAYILTFRNTKIPVYSIRNNSSQPTVPTIDSLEKNLEEKIKKDIELIDFKNFSYVSSLSIENVNIELNKDSDLNIKYKILIVENDFSKTISEEYKEIWSLNFEKMLEISKNVTRSHKSRGLEIDILNLNKVSEENNVSISVDIVDFDTLVYIISDKNPEGGMFYIAIKNEI